MAKLGASIEEEQFLDFDLFLSKFFSINNPTTTAHFIPQLNHSFFPQMHMIFLIFELISKGLLSLAKGIKNGGRNPAICLRISPCFWCGSNRKNLSLFLDLFDELRRAMISVQMWWASPTFVRESPTQYEIWVIRC